MIPEITLNVSELNNYISGIIKRDGMLRNVRVRGEIGSFKHHFASGHWYFNVKDDTGSINCVMYRNSNVRSSFIPQDGMKVIMTGSVDVWAKTAQLQFNVTAMRPDGEGNLWMKMEALKVRLAAEGLLDPGRKKPIPMYPKKIAVVTSESGAVWHDIINVSGERNKAVRIVLVPVSVQGNGAEKEIAEGIRIAQSIPEVEVIIVGRGGGSMEDLWCFNEECVARAVAECKLPLVSAVGHETDYTICDMVADVRASTPSNAAEIVVPTVRELMEGLDLVRKDLTKNVFSAMETARQKVLRKQNEMMRFEPSRHLSELRAECGKKKLVLEHLMRTKMRNAADEMKDYRNRLTSTIEDRISKRRAKLELTREKLSAISPLAVMERGYAIVSDAQGKVISSVCEAEDNEVMKIRFRDGETEVERRKRYE